MRIRYVGSARPGVEVDLPDGVTVHVDFDEVRTFPDEVARSLLEQGEQHWRLVSHYGDRPEPAELGPLLRPGDVARAMLRRLRNDRGWTQQLLATRLAEAGYPLGQSDISKTESGLRQLSIDDLVAICAVLNVAPGRVLEGARLDPQPPVAITPRQAVPLSRFRRWLRGSTPLPAASDWKQVSDRPFENAYRAVLAPEDQLGIQRRLVDDLIPATQEIADAAVEARDQLPDATRTRLADAIDSFNTRLRRLQENDQPDQPRQERRGRPRATPRPNEARRRQKASRPAAPDTHRT